MARLTGGRLASSRTTCSGSKLILRTARSAFPAGKPARSSSTFSLTSGRTGAFSFWRIRLSNRKGEQRGEEEEGMFFMTLRLNGY